MVERHVHFGWGHGPGLLDFLWDVDLLGKRVAYYLSSENEEGWRALDDIRFERDNDITVRREPLADPWLL